MEEGREKFKDEETEGRGARQPRRKDDVGRGDDVQMCRLVWWKSSGSGKTTDELGLCDVEAGGM